MKRLFLILSLAVLAALSSPAAADTAAGATGMLFGADHAFRFTAPKEWLLDNKSGAPKGLFMVFYPVGYAWGDSPVIVYGRAAGKTTDVGTIAEQVKATVDSFHRHGSPGYRYSEAERLKIGGGRVVHLYTFSGDRWGNYEAAGYIEEKETINFLVMTARKKEDFDRYYPDFKSLLRSYRNMYSGDADDEAFSRLVKEAKRSAGTKQGKAYEEKLLRKIGQSMANIMRDCTSFVPKEDVARFELILRIDNFGRLTEIHARPSNALTACVKGMVRPLAHPPHAFDTFVEHIEMEIKE